MKPITKYALASLGVSAIAIAALVVAHGAAEADARGAWHGPWHGGPPMHAGGPGMLASMMLEQLDLDHDGKISRAEIVTFRGDKLAAFDASKDGVLSLDEFRDLWMDLTRPLQVRAFQFLDADGDGKVTLDEMARPTDRLLARFDGDGDGSLDITGRRGSRPDHEQR